MLDLLAGYEPGDATWAPPPPEPFAAQAVREPGRLRVAMTTISPVAAPVDPACAAAVQEAAALLASLGHQIEEATPPGWEDERVLPLFMALWGAMVAGGVRWGATIAGREPTPDDIEPLTWAFYQRGMAQSAPAYAGVMAQLQAYARRLVAFFADYDVFLLPSLGQRPLRVGQLDTCGADPLAEFDKGRDFTPFTAVWNVTGQPAISLPLFQGEDGLPLGVQLVGPPAGEGLLLSLAAQVERARPWAERHPQSR
jgi:amidase